MKTGTFRRAERQVDPVVEPFSFILYVAGNLPNSVQAVWNMKAICGEYFAGNYELEVVDVFTDPQRGLRDAILAIPTLVKLKPDPKQIIMGNLSDYPLVLSSMGWTGPIKGQ